MKPAASRWAQLARYIMLSALGPAQWETRSTALYYLLYACGGGGGKRPREARELNPARYGRWGPRNSEPLRTVRLCQRPPPSVPAKVRAGRRCTEDDLVNSIVRPVLACGRARGYYGRDGVAVWPPPRHPPAPTLHLLATLPTATRPTVRIVRARPHPLPSAFCLPPSARP